MRSDHLSKHVKIHQKKANEKEKKDMCCEKSSEDLNKEKD